jgi:hypothetical protein
MPITRWCRCRPEDVSMLPGHHETWARIIRVLVRMNRKERTNPSKTSSAPPRPGWVDELNGSTTMTVPRNALPVGVAPITHPALR